MQEKKVPDDISVIGFDGISLSNYCIPRLTTIKQDTEKMAREGVELMLRQIHYPDEGGMYLYHLNFLKEKV